MPLPEESMVKRFKEVFEAFKKGQSATLIGLPYCGKAGFFRSIIDTNHDLYNRLTKGYKFHFVLLDLYNGNRTPENFRNYILERFTQSQSKNVEKLNEQNQDIKFTFSQIKDLVSKFGENERLIFVVFGVAKYAQESPEIIKLLKELYYLHFQPKAKICFFFPGDPVLLKHQQLYEIQPLVHQNVFFFDTLTQNEIDYIRRRLELIDNIKIDNNTHLKICQLSGNHYYLYKIIAKSYVMKIVELDVKEISENPQIKKVLLDIYHNSISVLKENEDIFKNKILMTVGLINNGKFLSPLFPLNTKDMENVKFTAQELIVFEYLRDKLKKVVSKEKIAKAMWGKNWVDQYSEQALDKLINRLKHKLKHSDYNLVVLRNQGIRLSTK